MSKYNPSDRAIQASSLIADGVGSLGIIAKSSSPQITSDDLGTKRDNFNLLRVARKMLFDDAKEKSLIYPKHRTASCWYCSTANVNEGEVPALVNRKNSGVKTEFIAKCKSVWSCPVCSHHIESFRRKEIGQAFAHFYENEKNKQASLITFTFPHGFTDSCVSSLKKQKKAFERLRSGKAWKTFKEVFGMEGLIRGLETTYSVVNGWHPHTHEIWFMDSTRALGKNKVRIADYIKSKYRFEKWGARREHLLSLLNKRNGPKNVFESILIERWIDCCIKSGLATEADRYNMVKRSVDVSFNARSGDYIAKMDSGKKNAWGADAEVASSKSKRSVGVERFHPFDFLTKYKEESNPKWRRLFCEYSDAFKGKRHLFWSAGLKKRCGIEDIEDEDLDLEAIEEEMESRVEIKEFNRFRSSPRTAIIAFETTIKNKMNQSEAQSWVDDAIDSIPERRWCDIQDDFTFDDESKWKLDLISRNDKEEYRRDLSLMYLSEQNE